MLFLCISKTDSVFVQSQVAGCNHETEEMKETLICLLQFHPHITLDLGFQGSLLKYHNNIKNNNGRLVSRNCKHMYLNIVDGKKYKCCFACNLTFDSACDTNHRFITD